MISFSRQAWKQDGDTHGCFNKVFGIEIVSFGWRQRAWEMTRNRDGYLKFQGLDTIDFF